VLTALNLYGVSIDEILLRTDFSVTPNRTLYYQDDHEGSITHLTNSSGAVIESYRYDAFGAPSINGGTLPLSAYGNRFLFTGREFASTFGVYEYRARAYNPAIGRFMSEDPKGFAAGDYNLFRYCANDPLDKLDPMGTNIVNGADNLEILRFRKPEDNMSQRLNNPQFLFHPITMATANSKGPQGGFSQGPAYKNREDLPTVLPLPGITGPRGLIYTSSSQREAIVEASIIGKEHTDAGVEGAVGVTSDGHRAVGLTYHYSLGTPGPSGSGAVSMPRLDFGHGDLHHFIGQGHGHDGNQFFSGGDRLFSNVNQVPVGITNDKGTWIYVPKAGGRLESDRFNGEYWKMR
jgi:RHS repeat-associated protein